MWIFFECSHRSHHSNFKNRNYFKMLSDLIFTEEGIQPPYRPIKLKLKLKFIFDISIRFY